MKTMGAKVVHESPSKLFRLCVCLLCQLCLFLLRFGLPWFAKRIIVASNDINEDTLFSLNQQVNWQYLMCCTLQVSHVYDLKI